MPDRGLERGLGKAATSWPVYPALDAPARTAGKAEVARIRDAVSSGKRADARYRSLQPACGVLLITNFTETRTAGIPLELMHVV